MPNWFHFLILILVNIYAPQEMGLAYKWIALLIFPLNVDVITQNAVFLLSYMWQSC